MSLELVKTVTASSVSDVEVTNIFTTDYDFYKIIVTDLDISSNSVNLEMRYLNSSGTEITTQHSWLRHGLQNTRTYLQQGASSVSDFDLINIDSTNAHNPAIIIYVYDPLNTNYYTLGNYESMTYNLNPNNYKIEGNYGAIHYNNTQALSGVKFKLTSGTIEQINIKVYGFLES